MAQHLACGQAGYWDDQQTACGIDINNSTPYVAIPLSWWTNYCTDTYHRCFCGQTAVITVGNQSINATIADVGPSPLTGRVADLNQGAVDALGLKRNDLYNICLDIPMISTAGGTNMLFAPMQSGGQSGSGQAQVQVASVTRCPPFSVFDPGPAITCWATVIIKYLLVNLAAAAVFAYGLKLAFAPQYEELKQEIVGTAEVAAAAG